MNPGALTFPGWLTSGRKRILKWTAILIVLWLLASFIFAYWGTRRPHPVCAEPAPTVAWGKFESLRLPTEDGETLGAWYMAGQPDRPTVIVLHGHRGRRSDCVDQAEIFATSGCSLLLVSMRAHGDSTGDYNDVGYSSRKDVLAAVGWLEKNHPGQPIVIYGQSMGAAAATFACAELGDRVHGYILESPYRDLRTAVWNRFHTFLVPGVDYLAYVGVLTVSPLVLPDLDRIAPVDAVVGMPPSARVLILAGSKDRRARPEEARAICERIPGRAELVIVDGADHGRLRAADPDGYRKTLREFVAKVGQP